jgi:hypothetical protein
MLLTQIRELESVFLCYFMIMKPHFGLTIFQLSTGANRAEKMNVINQENVQNF